MKIYDNANQVEPHNYSQPQYVGELTITKVNDSLWEFVLTASPDAIRLKTMKAVSKFAWIEVTPKGIYLRYEGLFWNKNKVTINKEVWDFTCKKIPDLKGILFVEQGTTSVWEIPRATFDLHSKYQKGDTSKPKALLGFDRFMNRLCNDMMYSCPKSKFRKVR